ncbi:MAG: hypothetical protein GTO63_11470, partial [Anaerolineae bacterium]|nr:hypothetical protein [Anaerolineae bacterium]
AEAFDVNASVCLQAALDKFYTRARTQAMQEAEEQCDRIEIPFGMGAHPLARGLSILQSDARHRVTNCEGFQPGGLTGNEPDYCKLCGVHKEYHGPGGAERLSFFQEPEGVEPADELDRQKGE